MIQEFFVPITGRQIDAAGNFFRYEAAGVEGNNQAMRLRIDGNDAGTMLPGDAIEIPLEARRWELIPVNCSATVKVGFGRITTVRSTIAGTVSTSLRGVALANTARTVTTASAALIAANASRAYLAIQNKDPAGSIWVTFGGAAATQANGLRIGPGGFWEWDGAGAIPTGAANAIGDVASNVNVVTLEG